MSINFKEKSFWVKILSIAGGLFFIFIVIYFIKLATNPFFSCNFSFNPSFYFSDCASCRGDCYASIAYEKNDLSICDKINNTDLKNRCNFAVAEKRQDPEICKNAIVVLGLTLGNERGEFVDSCLFNVNLEKKDPTICEMMSKISNKDSCYAHLGIQTKNIFFCNKIEKDIEARNSCIDRIK